MGKILKPGKVVVILSGKYAGKKAIVVKVLEEGSREREFGHVLVAGISGNPKKVTKSMSKKKILARSKVKPFVKYVNFRHIMPTRYSADIDLKDIVTTEAVSAPETKKGTLYVLCCIVDG
jgi:large subunit ribosomal protein L27e